MIKKKKPKTTDRAGDHFQEICSLWNWASNWECTDLFRLLSLNTRMGNLNSRNFFAHSSRGWRSTVKMPVALVCGEVCRWGLPIVPSRGLLSVHKQERGLGREEERKHHHTYLFCYSFLSLFSYPGLSRLDLKGGPPWEEAMEPSQNGGAVMPRCVAGETDLGHGFMWSTSGLPGRATDFLCFCFISSVILSLFPISNMCSSPLFTLRQPRGSSSHSTFPHPWLQL